MLFFALLPLFFVFSHSTDRVCTDNFQFLNNQNCIRFYPQTPYSTHKNSVYQCNFDGAFPVSIRNAIDNNYISKLASSSGSQSIWLGLNCFGNTPSMCFWDDGSGNASSYSQFAAGYPDTSVGECVTMMTSGGKWRSSPCSDINDYVCEMPPTYPDENCDFVFADNCYYISSEDDDFVDLVAAELDCQSRGMHLASIHSFSEFEYIRRGISSNMLAIGARQTSDNTFEWLDGTPWDYQRMMLRNETDGGCVYIRGWGQGLYDNLETMPCSSANRRYICKKPVVLVNTSPSNPSGCNATLITVPGVITSPNYPNVYPNNLKCNYLIRSPDGLRFGILFTDVMTQAEDVITVYNGTDQNAKVLQRISGEQRNQLIYSYGNSLFLTFETDASKVGFGFRAQLDVYLAA